MEIRAKRTCIEISPYTEDNRVESIEKYFSIYDKRKYKYEPLGLSYDAESKTLILPRSASLRKLELEFGVPTTVDRSYDRTDKAIIKLNSNPRNDKQREAIAFLLGKEEYSDIELHSRRMLELDTGIGKTYCSVAALSYLKEKGAVIINSKKLLNQWIEKIQEYTNLTDKEIFVVAGKQAIQKILDGKCKKYKIFIISHSTISSYAKRTSWSKVHELFELMAVGVKIFDEAHLELNNTIKIDLHTNTRRTFYLTATAERSNYIENSLYKKVYGTVPVLEIKRQKKDAYVKSYLINYDSKPSMMQEGLLKTRYGMNVTKYIDYMVFGKGQEMFIKSLILIFNTILERDGIDTIAVLCGRIKATEFVKSFLEVQYPKLKDNIGILTSKSKDKDGVLKKKVIVTTFKSFGTGIDLNDKLSCIVMCEPYSSKVTLHQCIGRLRFVENKDLIYFELVDQGVKQRVKQIESIKKELLKCSEKVVSFNIV